MPILPVYQAIAYALYAVYNDIMRKQRQGGTLKDEVKDGSIQNYDH